MCHAMLCAIHARMEGARAVRKRVVQVRYCCHCTQFNEQVMYGCSGRRCVVGKHT